DLLAQQGHPPELLHCLVAELLQASIEKEPEKRVRTRADLKALISKTTADLSHWLASSRAVNLNRAVEDILGVKRWLTSRHLELDRDRVSPSRLLTANYEIVDFNESGRSEALEALAAFANGPRTRDLWIVHGDGGLGKTRLLMEGCRRLAAQGWHAGFLDPDADARSLAELLEGLISRLVVVDYAESRLPQVQKLVSRMARAPLPGPRVRVVLLARREGDWLKTLRQGAEEADLLDGRYASMELPPLSTEGVARWDPFAAAVRAFTFYLRVEEPALWSNPDLSREAFGRPLYLHMAALIAAEGRPAATEELLLEEILERERFFWSQEIKGLCIDSEKQIVLQHAMERMLAVLSLGGGLSEAQCRTLAHQLLGSAASAALSEILVNLVRSLYAAAPHSGWHVAGLEPDLLSEEFVLQALRPPDDYLALRRGDDYLERSFDWAPDPFRRHALTVLGRIAQTLRGREIAKDFLLKVFEARLSTLGLPALEVAVAVGDPLGQILAPCIERKASFEVALQLMVRCDKPDFLQSVPLREVALAATLKVYDELKALERVDNQDRLAACAARLGIRLSQAGRHQEALSVAEEAVEIYRALAQENPKEMIPRLAFSLTSLGMRLSELEKFDEAFSAAREAVEIWRQVAEFARAFQGGLATSLNNLGLILNLQRRFQEALSAFQEAADIRKILSRSGLEIFKSDLGESLCDLALCLRALKQYEQALNVIFDAEIIFRGLARDRPDAFLPELARTLNTLCMMLNDLGHHEEAIRASQEAENIFRQLANQRPASFMPQLANSLDLLGSTLARAARYDEALARANEAVEIYRSLAQRFKTYVLQSGLAAAMDNLTHILSAMERHKEAFETSREAVQELLAYFRSH